MKLKRLLSCALALALTLTMTVLPTSAAALFPDIETHWARSYIELMTLQGMFKGYEDGKFKPENKLTAAEALALCARAVPIDQNTGTRIGDDRKADLDAILRGDQSWFYREFGICLETGILTQAELKELFQTGALTKPIAKEDLSRYLVRAMQLGPMAERLTAYGLSFTDTAAISAKNQPYVYLLNIYDIVQGDQTNAFGPKGDVTRAVMATMLARAISFMGERGVSPDLPNYTSYEFKAGTVAAVSKGGNDTTLLTLTNPLTGQTYASVTLDSSVPVYENNMKSGSSALKVGRYVRVALNSRGSATQVRVSGSLETFSGQVSGIDGDYIALNVNGASRMVAMDRFTLVQVGAKTSAVGGPALVDENAGYTDATCQLDDQGRLVALQLTGGTREETGIFAGTEKGVGSLAGSTVVRLIGFDGVTHQYAVPADAVLLVNGLSVTSLSSSSYTGSYASVRLSNAENTAATINVDTVTKYVQGAVKGVSASSGRSGTITISNIQNGKSTTYDVLSSAIVTYNNEETLLRNLEKNYFVTARLDDGDIIRLDAYPGSAVTEGILTNRTFDSNSGVTLEVTQVDDSIVTFRLDLNDLPAIYRSDEGTTIDKLRMGDTVIVTVRYSSVTRIEATPQEANVVATIDRIIQESGGNTLEMTLVDGTKVTYTILNAAEVTQNNRNVGITGLKPGQKLAMVVSGTQITSAEIQQSTTLDGKLEGTVIYVNTSSRELLLRVLDAAGNEELVTVRTSGAVLMQWDGSEAYLRDIKVGDTIQCNGKYDGSVFAASLILRQ